MIRLGFAVVAAGVLAAGCGSAPSREAADRSVDEGKGVLAGVRFGDTADAVRGQLGEPSDDNPGFFPARASYTGPPAIPAPAGDQGTPPTQPTELHYGGKAFLVSSSAGVFSMATLEEDARTKAGVAIGDPLETVRGKYQRVTCGKQVAGEAVLGGEPPKYRWCRALVGGTRVFFGGDPIESITLTRYAS